MDVTRVSGAGLAVTALLVSIALAGCSKDEGSSTASSAGSAASSSSSSAESSAESSTAESSPAPESADYSSLLIPATDVGDNATTPGPPQLNPGGSPGVGQVFASPDGLHRVIDTILVFPDAATADSNFTSNKATLNEIVTGTPEPFDVGTNGTIAAGTSPDGAKAVTVIMFSEGRALVHLSFEGPPGDNVPQEIGQDIASKQADAVKAGLPAE
ncbi:hypothetical protein BH09ACT8_BH09ACT8_24290 [soil metagenome]